MDKRPNQLLDEKSPYLLQHAYNPVNWYPWGEEAFHKAKEEDKPIFLSIGYSTCFWCHNMAHESFEDLEVAKLLNQSFIAIKVDKEERPDIDSVYMQVCQRMTGQGGWPLTIIMDGDQKPFYAATYIPKTARHGMYGLVDLLPVIAKKWKEEREELLSFSKDVLNELNQQKNIEREDIDSEMLILQAKGMYEKTFDHTFGGFGSEPKFPTPHQLLFLLRYAHDKKDENALFMVESTLDHMYRGGIYDHIGFGFSRYSTDRQWLVPHFEKMLYDNALLMMIYSEAYQKTKKQCYKNVVDEIYQYIRREMTNLQGGFFCAQDSASDGIEGKYYLLTKEEVIQVLGKEEGQEFCDWYDSTEKGNFEGKNIPNLIYHSDTLEELKISQKMEEMKKKLYDYRLARTQLHKDDKIITSWNALMISALAKAYQVTRRNSYLLAAKKGVEFIESNMVREGRIFLSYREGTAYGVGHIDDYAFYVWALLEMYQATFELFYLTLAIQYHKTMIELFFDEDQGGCYLYSKESEKLFTRPKETYDGAIPSGNAVATYNMVRLFRLTKDRTMEEQARKQMNFMKNEMKHYPSGHGFGLLGIMQQEYMAKDLVCVVRQEDEIKPIQEKLCSSYMPGLLCLMKRSGEEEELTKISEFTKEYKILDNRTTYYLCEGET
ncbi:MAG TPA: thioredoxin domain-containing protein, partial [Candidatus Merdenecus merdavium]|nr:thioredoxin domain-containing protein [Candidatus Merdenecus merdavium]